jgi:PAS domain S-box-containing protein
LLEKIIYNYRFGSMKKIRRLEGISHIVLFATILVAAGAIVLVHYNEYKNITKSISSTENTENLDKKTTTMKLGLQQMIINQRAYILLGKAKYREKFFSYYNVLDDYIIDISKDLNDEEADKLIKGVNSNIFELKLALRDRIIERDRGNLSKFLNKADNEKLLNLYDNISEELEQLSWMVWSKHQADIKNTKEAYSNYSISILVSSLLSVMILAVLGAMLIFSQRKTSKAQSELGDLNKRLNILLQATSDGILDWDVKENKLLISPKFKKLLGYEDDEIRSDFDSLFDLIHPDDQLSTWLYAKKIITPEQPIYNQMFRMKHKDGSWAWISAKGIGFFDNNGELERFVGVHTDVTLQKNLESMLKYSKDKAEIEGQQKSDFLAYMSHEIRSPISAVVGLTKILTETSPLTEEQKKYLDALKTGADTVYSLLNNILDLSKLEAHAIKLEKTEFNLNQILTHAVTLSSFAARTKNLKLNSDIPNEADMGFMGDPHRIKQIVTNLLNNAIKFTESGSVNLSVKLYPDISEKIRVEIIVADTGIGIERDRLAVIFNPYAQSNDDITRKYGGTGLGLTICKQFVELMGGKIEVESEKGKGSKFKVTVALDKVTKMQNITPAKIKKPKAVTKGNILLVEDSAPNAVVAKTIIENLGYTCILVTTAKEAILQLSTQSGKNIDVVLMDVQLPDMNGFEATKLIRKLEKDNSQTPRKIIAMTAHDLIGDREKCLLAGMDDYISKPFDPHDLSEKLKQPLKIKATG